jgi:hypothetical protein
MKLDRDWINSLNKSWFENWENSINERINSFKILYPREVSDQLDFSLKSLFLVERLLLDKFDKTKEAKETEHYFYIDQVVTYVGEVYRKNDSRRMFKWIWPDTSSNEYQFLFPALKCINIKGADLAPSKKILVAINLRNGDLFHEYFLGSDLTVNRILAQQKEQPVEVIQDKGYSYQHFILINDENFSLSEVENRIKDLYTRMKREVKIYYQNDSYLLLDMGNDYQFHFQLDKGTHVAEESKEIAEGYTGEKDKALIASCKQRIDFWGDEDADADHINDYMFILQELDQDEKLLIFNFRNGMFFDEE